MAPHHPPNPGHAPRQTLSRRDASALLLMLGSGLGIGGLGGFASCGPVRPPRVSLDRSTQPKLVPTAARIDAVPGRSLVMQVRVDGPISGNADPRLTLADGRDLGAALVWIGVEADRRDWSGWLPAFERWVVAAASDSSIPASIGAWHIVAALPADSGAQELKLNGRSVPVNWIADPDTLRPANVRSGWEPWTIGSDAPQPDARLLAPEWRSPLRLWHARLVTTSLGRAAATPGLWQVKGDHTVLDRLAELTEARWRVGLARLWYADAVACARLLRMLGRTVELSSGTHAPAWPTDAAALDSLLSDLLDPRLTGGALAVRAQVWVEALPRIAVWVEDDAAGLLGDASEPLVRIRAAGLGDEPQLIWTSGADDLRVGEPEMLGAGKVVEVSVPVSAGRVFTGGRSFTVRTGTQSLTIAAREMTPIRPPGMRCGPLLFDWTLTAWAQSQPRAGAVPDAAHAAAVLIYRDLSGASESGWAVFVECAGPEPTAAPRDNLSAPTPGTEPDDELATASGPTITSTRPAAGPGDEVSLWFGQRGRSAAVLRVSRAGVLRDDRTPGSEATLDVADEGDRWSVSVPIPLEAIEPGQVLRLGIARRDPRGVRTAWPRRLMPWDREPARAAIDLKTWSGLAGS